NIAPYDEQTVTAGGGKIDAIPVQGETNKLAFQLDANPLTQDKSIRLALQAATDREEINKTVLSPSYPVPTSLLVKGTPLRGDSSKYLTYDLDKAKSLLDADGWTVGPDGIRTKFGKRLHFDLWVSPYYHVPHSVLERLLSAQALQFDPAKRKAAIQAIEDYILGQGYVIPLYDETQVFGLGPKVHGFGTESTGRSWFYDTWLSQ